MYKLFVAFSLLIVTSAMAQPATDNKSLQQQEDSIKQYAKDMIFAPMAEDRLVADSIFTRMFVKALRTPYSFKYPFDSVITVSKLYAPDSTFRIFTWQFQRDESYFRQRGAIQMKTKDGSLKLFPLLDASQFTNNPTDSVRTNTNWIGAIYYNIIAKEYQGKKYYTLFGFDDNDFAVHANGWKY